MKWSELPQEYRDMEKDFDSLAFIFTDSDDISRRFRFRDTPQGWEFWRKCHYAETISELPQIPELKNQYVGIVDEYHTHN